MDFLLESFLSSSHNDPVMLASFHVAFLNNNINGFLCIIFIQLGQYKDDLCG